MIISSSQLIRYFIISVCCLFELEGMNDDDDGFIKLK